MNLREAFAALADKLAGWVHDVIVNLPNLLVALCVLVVFWLLGRLLRRGGDRRSTSA